MTVFFVVKSSKTCHIEDLIGIIVGKSSIMAHFKDLNRDFMDQMKEPVGKFAGKSTKRWSKPLGVACATFLSSWPGVYASCGVCI